MTQNTLSQLEALIDTLFEKETKLDARSPNITNSLIEEIERSQIKLEPSALFDESSTFVSLYDQLLNYQPEHNATAINKAETLEKSAATISELISLRFIDTLFSSNAINELPELLKHLVHRMKLPMLRLGILDLKLLCRKGSAPIKLLESLLQYSNCWKDESKIGYPTYTKLSDILEFRTTKAFSLSTQFENALKPCLQIHQNQTKRASIFEKRLFETEQSKLKTKRAEKIVSSVLSEIIAILAPADFLVDFIQDIWIRLLVLEFVRHDNKAFYFAVETIIEVLLTVRPKEHNLSLPKFIDRLPDLNKRILAGAKRLHCTDEETNNFISQLEFAHIEIISGNQNGQDELTQGSTSPLKVSSDDIIRLKPAGVFDSSIAEESHNKFTKSESKSKDKTITHLLIECLVAQVNSEESSPSEIVSILDFTKAHVTTQNRKDFSQVKALNKHFNLNTGEWFKKIEDNSTHKLLFIDDFEGNYYFIDSDTKLSLRFTVDEFKQLLHKEAIVKDNKLQLVANTAQSMLCDLSFIDDLKQLVNHQKKGAKFDLANIKDVINPSPTNTVPVTNKPQQPKIEKTLKNDTKTERGEIKTSKQFDMELLSVGSWVSFNSSANKVKAKFAARIRSKDRFIFVDRQGKKILELTSKELQQKIERKQITLVDEGSTNPVFLESVISKTRTLKNET